MCQFKLGEDKGRGVIEENGIMDGEIDDGAVPRKWLMLALNTLKSGAYQGAMRYNRA